MAKAALKTNHRQISDNRHNTKKRDSVICKLKLDVKQFLCRDESSRRKSWYEIKKDKEETKKIDTVIERLTKKSTYEIFVRER